MTRRRLASIEEHPKGSGRFRVRVRAGGATLTLASGVSRPSAQEVAASYEGERAPELRDELTLGQFGSGFLDRRERAGRGKAGRVTCEDFKAFLVAVGELPNIVCVEDVDDHINGPSFCVTYEGGRAVTFYKKKKLDEQMIRSFMAEQAS